MEFRALHTKDGDRFVDRSGTVYTARWDKTHSGNTLTLIGGGKIHRVGDFPHALDFLGLVKINEKVSAHT